METTEVVQLSATFLALFSTIAAFWAAKEARQSAIETRKASQAALVSELLDAYASSEMLESMISLRTFFDLNGLRFSDEFQRMRSGDWSEVKEIDHARRRVSHFFGKIHRLWAAGLIDEELTRVVATEGQVQFFREVIEPLEAALNVDYNRFSV